MKRGVISPSKLNVKNQKVDVNFKLTHNPNQSLNAYG
jgi:hypothetical protein